MKFKLLFFLTLISFYSNVSGQPFVRSWFKTWGNDSVPATMNFLNECADDFGNVYTHIKKDTVWTTTISMITKYNSSGQREWERSYYNPYDGRAYTTQIKCDQVGNVYLGGGEKSAGGKNTMLLLKYDSAGILQWKFNFPFSIAQAGTIQGYTFDSLTNIYLTSTVYIMDGANQHEDILITKLDSSGNVIWNKYMNYPDTTELHSQAGDIVEDNVGNFVISGYSQDSSILAKLDPLGNFIWLQNKPITHTSYRFVLDNYNSIYSFFDSSSFSILIKIDSSGTDLWQKNITQLDSCKINYLTCKKNYLYTAGDRGILKLDLNGDSLWRRHYNTGPGFTDEYKKIAVSENEDVTVAGNLNINPPTYGIDLGITRYDSSGNLKWHLQYNNNLNTNDDYKDVILNSTDNLFVGSEQYFKRTCPQLISISSDTLTITSDVHRNYQQSDDYSTKIAKDNSGNIIIAGDLLSSDLEQAIGVVKYDNSGNEIWDKTIKKVNSISYLTSLNTDDHNNIYITGAHYTSITYKSEGRLIKLNSNGDTIYQITHQITPYYIESFLNFVSDHSGNIYLLETGKDSSGLYFFQILKYDSSGNYIWNKFIADSAESSGKIIIDEYDNIFYSYRTFGTVSRDWDIVVSMMDTAGNDIWTTQYDSPNNSFDVATDMKLDHDKNIVLASICGISDWDLNVIKLDSTGQFLWNSVFIPHDLTISFQYRLAIDESNNIYIAGFEDSTNVIRHGITIKLEPDGTFGWKNKIRSNSHFNRSDCNAIAAGNGFVYVSGSAYNSSDHTYLFLAVYDTLGALVYLDSISAPYSTAGDPQQGLQIIYDTSCVYLTGRVYTAAEEAEFSAFKYCNSPVGISENHFPSFDFSIFPNPSNGTFSIHYNARENSKAEIEIYNLVGENILKKQVSLIAGQNEFQFNEKLSAGSYFVRIKLNKDYFISEKLIILD